MLINAGLEQINDSQLQEILSVSRWVDGQGQAGDAVVELLYQPTLNIDGIWGGYTEEGVKTILPHMATAKVDSRLPPGTRPRRRRLPKIRGFLDSKRLR